MPEPRNVHSFSVPARRRSPRWLWAVAIALHVPVVLLLVVLTRRARIEGVERNIVGMIPLVPPRHDETMIYVTPRVAPRDSAPRFTPRTAPRARPTAVVAAPRITPEALPAPAPVAVAPPTTNDTGTRVVSTLRPQFGSGQLWVRPLPAAPREMASGLTGRSPAEVTDSAVTAIMQEYLNQMAREKPEEALKAPSWTTKIAGKTVGLDSKWLYLGPVKIPAALLALLPINLQANPTTAEFNKKLQVMRADLMDAARRAANYHDFKEAVKTLRKQKQDERDFKQAQRTPPPPDTGRGG